MRGREYGVRPRVVPESRRSRIAMAAVTAAVGVLVTNSIFGWFRQTQEAVMAAVSDESCYSGAEENADYSVPEGASLTWIAKGRKVVEVMICANPGGGFTYYGLRRLDDGNFDDVVAYATETGYRVYYAVYGGSTFTVYCNGHHDRVETVASPGDEPEMDYFGNGCRRRSGYADAPKD